MYLDFVKSLFFLMHEHNLGYIYKGIFTPEVTDTVLYLTEHKLEKQEESIKLKKRVYNILVESLQNVIRHQAKDHKRNPFHDSLFLIQKIENRYVITTGNIIKTENVSKLQSLLDKINELSKEELKEFYLKILSEGEFSEKGGAGLGLLDIARKSGNKLLYKFVPFSQNYSYFYLCIIPILEDSSHCSDYKNDFKFVELIHSILNKEDISIINNGPFNQENLLIFLNSLEGQMIGNVGYKKKVYYIVIEMIQNIIKHGFIPENYDQSAVPGIFLLGQINNKYRILTGNFIENKDLYTLKEKIDKVNNMNSDQLNNYFNDFLFDFANENYKKAGLGLIDIRIKSQHKIDYDILPINENYSFLTLQSLVNID